jgi:hypothetical protein
MTTYNDDLELKYIFFYKKMGWAILSQTVNIVEYARLAAEGFTVDLPSPDHGLQVRLVRVFSEAGHLSSGGHLDAEGGVSAGQAGERELRNLQRKTEISLVIRFQGKSML